MDIEDILIECIDVRRSFDNAPAPILGLKLMEEVGEFGEATLKHLGYLRHKEVKETPFGEAADIVNVVLGMLASMYPDLDSPKIIEELVVQIQHKKNKYESIMREWGNRT